MAVELVMGHTSKTHISSADVGALFIETWLFWLPEILRPSRTMQLYNLLQIYINERGVRMRMCTLTAIVARLGVAGDKHYV